MRSLRALCAIAFAAVLLLPASSRGQSREQVDRYRRGAEAEILRELAGFVAIPNLASDRPNIERNAQHLLGMLRRRGIEARLLETPGAPPAVYGDLPSPGARRTVVVYAHYDGQPVDPAQWKSPPWTPVLLDKPLEQGGRELPLPGPGQKVPEEARLYARSASDDKAPIVAMLSALDALRAAGTRPSVHLKFYFEGEEEAESAHLRESLERHRDLLQADAWIFCDGPIHQSRRMQVVYGARGVVPLELTVYGPSRALHDGHYGNWAPNPAALLASLLSSMRDPDGRVTIAGFYDGVRPVSDLDRKAIAEIPDVDAELRRSVGLAHTTCSTRSAWATTSMTRPSDATIQSPPRMTWPDGSAIASRRSPPSAVRTAASTMAASCCRRRLVLTGGCPTGGRCWARPVRDQHLPSR